jgi:hypothetical protein
MPLFVSPLMCGTPGMNMRIFIPKRKFHPKNAPA